MSIGIKSSSFPNSQNIVNAHRTSTYKNVVVVADDGQQPARSVGSAALRVAGVGVPNEKFKMWLCNASERPQAYKLSVNNPDQVYTAPRRGIIPPGGEVEVQCQLLSLVAPAHAASSQSAMSAPTSANNSVTRSRGFAVLFFEVTMSPIDNIDAAMEAAGRDPSAFLASRSKDQIVKSRTKLPVLLHDPEYHAHGQQQQQQQQKENVTGKKSRAGSKNVAARGTKVSNASRGPSRGASPAKALMQMSPERRGSALTLNTSNNNISFTSAASPPNKPGDVSAVSEDSGSGAANAATVTAEVKLEHRVSENSRVSIHGKSPHRRSVHDVFVAAHVNTSSANTACNNSVDDACIKNSPSQDAAPKPHDNSDDDDARAAETDSQPSPVPIAPVVPVRRSRAGNGVDSSDTEVDSSSDDDDEDDDDDDDDDDVGPEHRPQPESGNDSAPKREWVLAQQQQPPNSDSLTTKALKFCAGAAIAAAPFVMAAVSQGAQQVCPW